MTRHRQWNVVFASQSRAQNDTRRKKFTMCIKAYIFMPVGGDASPPPGAIPAIVPFIWTKKFTILMDLCEGILHANTISFTLIDVTI